MILEKLYKKTSGEVSAKVDELVSELYTNKNLSDEDFLFLLDNISESNLENLFSFSRTRREEYYGNKVYMRGLIEFTNYCNRGCLYCGISKYNNKIDRYRLTKDEIFECCDEGDKLGFQTYVLQGGEDPYYTDEILVDIISTIKKRYPEKAITMSFGERSKESYQKMFDAGADRYLLRHETASKDLYNNIHDNTMSYDNRIECLHNLKNIGYQVGCGFMVNTPTQTNLDLLADIRLIQNLRPEMCGIGPYLSHDDTPLSGNESGTLEQTLVMVALTRLVMPDCLMPSTTALGTLDKLGREKALKAGANIVMPNLSPTVYRDKYEIYQNKICTGDEAAQCRNCIELKIFTTGYEVDMEVGHHVNFRKKLPTNTVEK